MKIIANQNVNLAGTKGAGFIGRAEELSGIKTAREMKKAMSVPYEPDYILEFQLKNTKGLQNLLKYDDPMFAGRGRTASGYSEYNLPGLTTKDIVNWRLRRLKK